MSIDLQTYAEKFEQKLAILVNLNIQNISILTETKNPQSVRSHTNLAWVMA